MALQFIALKFLSRVPHVQPTSSEVKIIVVFSKLVLCIYIYLNSKWDVLSTNSQILYFVHIFAS